jgi:hypothetical protein
MINLKIASIKMKSQQNSKIKIKARYYMIQEEAVRNIKEPK